MWSSSILWFITTEYSKLQFSSWFIHSLMDSLVTSISWLLWIVLQWIWVCRYLFKILIFVFLGYKPRSGIAESYGSSIFNFVRHFHIAFHKSCIYLYSHQQGTIALFPPYPHQFLLWFSLEVMSNSLEPYGL